VARRTRIKAVVLFAICGVALTVGALVLALGIGGELPYLGSRAWPTTRGVVTYSAAQTETTPWYDFPRSVHGTFRRPGKVQFGVVEYEYMVDGQVYASRVEVSGAAESRTLTDRFRRGGTVTVFYDPANPGRSALIPGIDTNSVAMQSVMAVTLFIMGGVGLRGTIRYWRRG
jgi:hypothetical protein